MSTIAFPQEVWDQDFASTIPSSVHWLWQGFISKGSLTLLTSQWKAGKTTLLSMLLARRKHGGDLAGFPVQPGKSVVISEESPALWAERPRRFNFGGNVCFFPQPFRGFPQPQEWQALIDRILALHDQHAIDLAVIDPLAPFCLGENFARDMFATLMPLTALTRRGLAVLLLHHPSKGDKPLGQAARGSGALLGHVDISIEMRHPGGDPLTRRRRFITLSRHADTPRRLLMELNAEGTDYVGVTDDVEDEFLSQFEPIRLVLLAAKCKLNRHQILTDWPADFPSPTKLTLWRWLDRAFKTGLVRRDGAGTKSDTFHYWLPEKEEAWKSDVLFRIREDDRLNRTRLMNLP